MPHVFISYSTHDRVAAAELADFLITLAVPVWWDHQLTPGDDFGKQIEKQICTSPCTVVIWSDSSCVSHWVLNEARLAQKLNKLIPLKLSAFSVDRVPLDLRHLHCADIQDRGALLRALESHGFALSILTDSNTAIGRDPLAIGDRFSVPFFDTILQAMSQCLCTRLQKIRGVIYRDLQAIPITEYAHNSVSHAAQCTNLVTELFYDAISRKLRELEVFVLGLFCFVHDVGMASRAGMLPEQIYRAHNVYAQEYVNTLKTKGFIGEAEADCTGTLCLMHNKDINRAKAYFRPLSHHGIRLSIIYSMFRVADMLDVETQPGEILRIKPDVVAQVVGELDFDPTQRMIRIWRGTQIQDGVFDAWKIFFDDRIKSLNAELTTVGAGVSWMVVAD